ncbi:MAG: DNA-formamidopyrimidine glycosylase [Microcystaceae cyanobacterium]
MPELPEVETVCRGLNRVTAGKAIADGRVLYARTLAYPTLQEFGALLEGATFQQWQRRGKYLLASLTKQGELTAYLGVHLRMTGQLLWMTQPQSAETRSRHTRLYFEMVGGEELQFVDIRTFGRIWAIPSQIPVETVITGLQKLGPEPFFDGFSVNYLAQKLSKSQRPIKTALLDQTLVAGLGNIYADEVLFKSGIQPLTPTSLLTFAQIESLQAAIIQVLETAIAAGGTTFSDFRDVTGINGNYGGIAWVYGRKGEACRVCGSPIERLKIAGRSSHFCPICQN